jgi:tetratricopeptide (TPR) repeat protein
MKVNRLFWIFPAFLSIWLFNPFASALEVNEYGRDLIQQATQAYSTDMEDRAIVTDSAITGYVNKLVDRLIPKGKEMPSGVSMSVTVIDSPRPELYSYVDGHMVVTTGVLFAVENEAQLAAVFSHETAHLVEGHYISMYQEIKAAEKKQRRKAAAGALFGALLDVAVDYAIEMKEIKEVDRLFAGEATYRDTMESMAKLGAIQSAYYSIKDVIDSIPVKDDKGQWIDPRQRFEPVADAQGMEYLALAGYDAEEASKGWRNVVRINTMLAKEKELAMGAWASQIRTMENLMELNLQRLRQSLGATGLVQTLSEAPAARATFVSKLVKLKEVQEAQKAHGKKKAKQPYMSFISDALVPKAELALEEERYEQAYHDYKLIYGKGVRTAPIVYGLAKSKLGDFAFGASTAEKKEAERHYKEAIRLDKAYALPYKGLGELYDDWERYEYAAEAYNNYLKLAPKAPDKRRIERKIKVLKRKANR